MGRRKQRDVLKKKKKRKTVKDRFAALTYMQASLSLFAVSLLIFALCIWRSAATGGGAGLLAALGGILGFAVACAGLGVTLYGHFAVRMEGKLSWKIGILCNGGLALILLLLYLSGIGG